MKNITEEMLAAYVDGEGSPRERAIVEQALERDPDLQEALACHRALKAAIDQRFSGVLEAPIPPRILQLISADNVKPSVVLSRRRVINWLTPAAIAASLAVGVGVGVLWTRGPREPATVALKASPPVADALSTLDDGEKRGSILMVASYRDSSENVCREFKLTGDSDVTAGLACIAENGSWRLVAVKPVAPKDAYLPAGEEAQNSNFPLITAAMRTPTTEEQEAFLAALRKRR